MFILYAACLRRNFNYCSKLSLQLILFQDFIEKEWKDNGRDKCTGPGAPADIGRGNLYICAGRCEKPRRGLVQDASFQITWQPQWSPATTLIPMSWTHPGGVSLLINLNNIQCVRCKKCVSSLIYWVIENKNCSPDDTWPGQWPWIKFRFIISYLIIFVWNCNADQYCSWVCKKCAKWVS